MPQAPNKNPARRDLSDQYPGLAKKDVKLITGNLLGVGKKVIEANPNTKQSRNMDKQVKGVVQRLKKYKNKTDAEVRLLDCAESMPSTAEYRQRRKAQKLPKLSCR